jgi:hypothetical protein
MLTIDKSLQINGGLFPLKKKLSVHFVDLHQLCELLNCLLLEKKLGCLRHLHVVTDAKYKSLKSKV